MEPGGATQDAENRRNLVEPHRMRSTDGTWWATHNAEPSLACPSTGLDNVPYPPTLALTPGHPSGTPLIYLPTPQSPQLSLSYYYCHFNLQTVTTQLEKKMQVLRIIRGKKKNKFRSNLLESVWFTLGY